MKTFHVKYRMEGVPAGFSVEEAVAMADAAPPEDYGSSTAVIVLSLAYPEDGSYSLMVLSKDGRTDAPVSDRELWKAWLSMAAMLRDREVGEFRASVCEMVVEMARLGFGIERTEEDPGCIFEEKA